MPRFDEPLDVKNSIFRLWKRPELRQRVKNGGRKSVGRRRRRQLGVASDVERRRRPRNLVANLRRAGKIRLYDRSQDWSRRVDGTCRRWSQWRHRRRLRAGHLHFRGRSKFPTRSKVDRVGRAARRLAADAGLPPEGPELGQHLVSGFLVHPF